jgi:hypothetical protein
MNLSRQHPRMDTRFPRPTVRSLLSGISDTLTPHPNDPSLDGTPLESLPPIDSAPELVPAFISGFTPDHHISRRFPETEYTEQTVEEQEPETPLLDRTLREAPDQPSGFDLLLKAMGISWNSHHHVLLSILTIDTEQHIMCLMCIPTPSVYATMTKLDIGVEQHQKQPIILDLLTRIMNPTILYQNMSGFTNGFSFPSGALQL